MTQARHLSLRVSASVHKQATARAKAAGHDTLARAVHDFVQALARGDGPSAVAPGEVPNQAQELLRLETERRTSADQVVDRLRQREREMLTKGAAMQVELNEAAAQGDILKRQFVGSVIACVITAIALLVVSVLPCPEPTVAYRPCPDWTSGAIIPQDSVRVEVITTGYRAGGKWKAFDDGREVTIKAWRKNGTAKNQ